MNLLYPVFKRVSNLPLVDPHATYEGELIACGAKPIAFMAQSRSTQPDTYLIPSKYDLIEQKQIEIADEAVLKGTAVKRLVETPMFPGIWPDHAIQGHFYCQPQFVDDMNELADGFLKYWTTGEFPELSREVGYFIGCTDADFAHPWSGLAFRFLNATAPIRRYCRAETLKHEAKTGTIKLRTRPDHP